MGDRASVPEEIAAALAGGGTVLTGKQRAARSLRQAVDRTNRAAGLGGWAPVRVLAWDAWTAELWHRMLLDGHTNRMLLNRTQERALWMTVIEGDAELATLRGVGSLAALASETYGGLAQYGGLDRLRSSATNSDTEAFVRWAERFEERCRERGYLPQARLEEALCSVWREKRGSLPAERRILLVGFDRLLPAQRQIVNALRETGCAVREENARERARTCSLMAVADEAAETKVAAEWARRVLKERPEARLAVLVPGLKDNAVERAALDRVFREVLAPGAQRVTAIRALPYEFSTGVSLERTPMAVAALDLLRWVQEEIGLDRLGALLLSPYFAGGGEQSARAEFDAYELRRRTSLRPEVSLGSLIAWVERSDLRERLPQMLVCLRRMLAVIRRLFGLGEQRSYADWAEAMRELLDAAGWAAAAGVDSVEFQTRERWESVLDELATLDFEGRRVLYSRALEALRGIAENTTFAAESREAAVQVMGPEEAAGLSFDAVWFLRAGDLSWPEQMAGSPLLSWPLRRELGMPGSDVAADAAQARRTTQRIAASGGEVVFSYARQTAEARQRPSALVLALGLEQMDAHSAESDAHTLVPLEEIEDIACLPALPQGLVQGGMSVLKAQAACAFHAFAEYRLFATDLETREPGMNASERGNAVHGMLERFWDGVETQAALKAMTSTEREALLRSAVDATLTKMKIRMDGATTWDTAYLDAQRQRLIHLGKQWLDLEAARAMSFTVARRESEEKNVAIGPLHLTLRLDRVDTMEDGAAVLIDYKTGPVSSSAWHGDRPDEPQLPLYAVLAGEMRLHAVAFGMVRAGEDMKLSGYAPKPGILTARPFTIETSSLEEQVEHWRRVLENLATRFVEGDARVSPKAYPATCQFCAHQLICRLDVASLNAEDDEESEFGRAAEDERG